MKVPCVASVDTFIKFCGLLKWILLLVAHSFHHTPSVSFSLALLKFHGENLFCITTTLLANKSLYFIMKTKFACFSFKSSCSLHKTAGILPRSRSINQPRQSMFLLHRLRISGLQRHMKQLSSSKWNNVHMLAFRWRVCLLAHLEIPSIQPTNSAPKNSIEKMAILPLWAQFYSSKESS